MFVSDSVVVVKEHLKYRELNSQRPTLGRYGSAPINLRIGVFDLLSAQLIWGVDLGSGLLKDLELLGVTDLEGQGWWFLSLIRKPGSQFHVLLSAVRQRL